MPTAAAQRAAEAELQRQKDKENAEAEKAREKRRLYQRRYREKNAEKLKEQRRAKYAERKSAEVSVIPVPSSESSYPCDAVIAAAVNHKNGITTIEAEGRTSNGDRVVLVESVMVDGVRYHRVKKTVYTYHSSKKSAIAAAKQENLKLILYGKQK